MPILNERSALCALRIDSARRGSSEFSPLSTLVNLAAGSVQSKPIDSNKYKSNVSKTQRHVAVVGEICVTMKFAS